MYWCVLKDKKGNILESFWREGNSETEVLQGLEMFQWPKGQWFIESDDMGEEND